VVFPTCLAPITISAFCLHKSLLSNFKTLRGIIIQKIIGKNTIIFYYNRNLLPFFSITIEIYRVFPHDLLDGLLPRFCNTAPLGEGILSFFTVRLHIIFSLKPISPHQKERP
jgi:hypothetical protein